MTEQPPAPAAPPSQPPTPAAGGVEDPAWSRMGRWDPVFELPNVAIHTHLLPNGTVLFWGRRDQPSGSLNEHECTPHLWDPRTGQLSQTPQPTVASGGKVNLFCAGHAFLPDGRLLVAGGHIVDSDGLDQACVYDYRTNTWTALPPMNRGRWYPTASTLADGRVLVMSGSFIRDGTVIINDLPQIWDGQLWQPTVNFIGLPLYPRLHVAPDGRVFMSGTNAQTYLLDTAGNGTWTPLPAPGGVRQNGIREYAPAVMYEPGKVLYVGGGNGGSSDVPTAAAEVIDLHENPSTWRATAPMHIPRRQHNATILADGTILVTGGTRGPGFNDLSPGSPVHTAELWDPATETWTQLAAEDVDRCYHATAVLLPDATVLSAGGGEFAVGGGANDPRDSHRNAQLFHPPYLFRGPRPQITSAPERIDYGQVFTVEVSGPPIERITWIRLGSVTHAFDQNQRINHLPFHLVAQDQDRASLSVEAPERAEICPPGHYLLFALSQAGVPAHARILQIGAAATAARAVETAAAALAGRPLATGEKTRTETLDEAVRAGASGTRVTIGLTAKCPYGLGACWAGAYEALQRLPGVAAVRPVANTADSTAEVYLRGTGLPDLASWPEQFSRSANRSYDFRGVEVTVTGTVHKRNGKLQLSGPSLDRPVVLRPLEPGGKVQWDHLNGNPKAATRDELEAYRRLARKYRGSAAGSAPIRVTGPLTLTEAEPVIQVRTFER